MDDCRVGVKVVTERNREGRRQAGEDVDWGVRVGLQFVELAVPRQDDVLRGRLFCLRMMSSLRRTT